MKVKAKAKMKVKLKVKKLLRRIFFSTQGLERAGHSFVHSSICSIVPLDVLTAFRHVMGGAARGLLVTCCNPAAEERV